MSFPLVTVIIPIYNTASYIRDCLGSVISQTLKNIQIICVDDGSTDRSLEIVNEFASFDSRIEVVKLKENVGGGRAKNLAINLVAAEYFVVVDSDDYCSPYMCEKAYDAITSSNSDVAYFGWNNVNLSRGDVRVSSRISLAPWAKIYRSSFIRNNNIEFYEGLGTHDYPYFIKAEIFYDKRDYSLLSEYLYFYRENRIDSIQTNIKYNSDNLFSIFKCYEKTRSDLPKDVFERNSVFINEKYKRAFFMTCKNSSMNPMVLEVTRKYFKKYRIGKMFEYYLFASRYLLKFFFIKKLGINKKL